ncbi:hypothetical protein EWM64_g5242 [Hericium alpestre]|uniref:Uncharacterized protein n=1 Tax=Hericium alpestre TaxID=135208 RepID=A0A4Y9ZV51_9AGAM|nr:hypothetical protein EWM64_g5242 [Hericium alpestre]
MQFSTPPHPFPLLIDSQSPTPTDAIPTHSRIDTDIQTDDHAPPLPSPSHADLPPPTPLDMVPATLHASANIQTDDHTPTLSPPTSACTMTLRIDAGIQSDAPTHALAPNPCVHIVMAARVDTDMQCDLPAHPTTCVHTSMPYDTVAPRIDTGVRVNAAVILPPTSLTTCIPDAPCTSMPIRARMVQEIEPDLLIKILAKAIAKGEAAGMKKGKHSGFQDGMEVGWKSGTRERYRPYSIAHLHQLYDANGPTCYRATHW